MKLLLQLLIVALILNACAQTGRAAWRYFEFKDAVQQEARFGAAKTTAQLQQRILALAEEHQVPLEPGDLQVTRDGAETFVSAAYFDYIELVPRFYTREHLFEIELNVSVVRPLTPDDIK